MIGGAFHARPMEAAFQKSSPETGKLNLRFNLSRMKKLPMEKAPIGKASKALEMLE